MDEKMMNRVKAALPFSPTCLENIVRATNLDRQLIIAAIECLPVGRMEVVGEGVHVWRVPSMLAGSKDQGSCT